MAHGTQLYGKELKVVVEQSDKSFVDLPHSVATGLPEQNKHTLVRPLKDDVLDEHHLTGKQGVVLVPNILTYSDQDSFVARQASQRPANLRNSGGIKVCERQLPSGSFALVQGKSSKKTTKKA
jgi:hypothetical protein